MTRKIKPRALKIAFWNAEGLYNARNEARIFIDEYNIDILLVNETHLRPSQNPKVPGYSLYRADRDYRGGGTAIYVRNNIDHFEVGPCNTREVEGNTVVINTATGPLRLSAIYKSPQKPLLDTDMDELLSAAQPTILAGDFNAKHPSWNSRVTNTSGRALRTYADNNNLAVYGPDEPTFFHRSGYRPDVLDILVAKDVTADIELSTVSETSSDHNPVIVTIDGTQDELQVNEKTRVCWPKFAEILEDSISCSQRISSTEQLEDAVNEFTESVTGALQSATKIIRMPAYKHEISDDIRNLIREKNQARRAWQRHGDIIAKATMNRLTREIRTTLNEARNENWQCRLETLSTEDKSIWQITRALRQKKINIPPIHGNTGLVFSEEEKAEAFADRLELQCSPSFIHCDLDEVEIIERHVRRKLIEEDNTMPKLTSPREIGDIVNHLNLKKAPGPDGINNAALKNLGRKGIVALANIFNASLRLRHFPDAWKEADVVVIPKPGQSLTHPQNYRPISLLSTVGKLLEKIMLTRLQHWATESSVIPDQQHGFRASHSTNHQLLRVTEYITQGFNRHQATGALFLDVAKAFDKVWHEGILYKLLQLEAPRWLVRMIASYLSNRTFRVKLGNTRSSKKTVTAGTPQGSLLSPLLFTIFTYDFPQHPNTMLAQYADDTAVLTRSTQQRFIVKRLQEAADDMEDWFRKWRIDVNASKSAAVFFTRRRKLRPLNNIQLFDEDVPWKASTKYLGLTLDPGLFWRIHTDSTVNKAKAIINQLYGMVNRRSRMSVTNKLLLYRAVIRPVLTYAAPIWGYAGSTQTNKLQVVQNKFARMAVDAPWFVRNVNIQRELKLEPIADFIKKSAEKFFATTATHSNRTISTAGEDYDQNTISIHKRPKMVLRD